MDNHMPGNVLQPWVGIFATANKIYLTLYGDFFRRPLLRNEQFLLLNAPDYLSIQQVTCTGPTSCELTLNADVSSLRNVSVKVMGTSVNTLKDMESNMLSATGVPSLEEQNELKVYAFGGLIYVNCPSFNESAYAEVINVWGQKCGQFSLQSESINAFNHNYSPGVYFVVVKAGKFSEVQRVVIL
jgi:hypothetical protein